MVIKLIALVCELLALLLLYHKVNIEKFCLDLITISFFITEISVFSMIYQGIIPYWTQSFIFIILFFYIQVKFDRITRKQKIGTFLFVVLVMGSIQLLVYIIVSFLPLYEGTNDSAVIISSVLCMFVSHIIKISSFYEIVKYNLWMRISIFVLGIFICALILLNKVAWKFTFLETVLISAIGIIVLLFCQQWKLEHEKVLAKEREIRLLEQNNDAFDVLIKDVRGKQHDFIERIAAIGSLPISCSSYEELVSALEECTSYIYRDNKYNYILTMNISPMMKGYLYGKLSRIEAKGFIIDYNINLDNEITLLKEFDMQEIIGVLLNNAEEEISKNRYDRRIRLMVLSEGNDIKIEVQNPSRYINKKETQHLFSPGFSTKGENRGLGLYNVQKIVKKNNGKIVIYNFEKSDINWLSVLINLPNFV